MSYRVLLGKKLHLENPKSFNEKIQWLKLNNCRPEYVQMVDKAEAKKYIRIHAGEKYVIPTLQICEQFNQIDFQKLPSQFVIKCTHDSSGVVVVKDYTQFDYMKAKRKIEHSLRRNYYYRGREVLYKSIKPRIIVEKYMEDESGQLIDYKVHCFNGKAKVILVCKDRFKQSGLTETFYDAAWTRMNVKRPNHNCSAEEIRKPEILEEMLEAAEKLSAGIPFLRVDFYEVNGKIYFGEITFSHWSGLVPFNPSIWDEIFGSWINLPLIEDDIRK